MRRDAGEAKAVSGSISGRRAHIQLDLIEVLAHVGLRRRHEFDEPPLSEDGLECAGTLRGHVIFTNTGGLLLVEGTADARVCMECSRCLIPFEMPVTVTLEEQFGLVTRAPSARGRRPEVVVEEDVNPQAGRLFDGPLFDLTELLRQSVSLAMPLQALHSEDCRGICPVCGVDRNAVLCSCEPQPVHRPLVALKDMIDRTK